MSERKINDEVIKTSKEIATTVLDNLDKDPVVSEFVLHILFSYLIKKVKDTK